MNSKSTITATVGYMCLALAGWMASMPSAGWFDAITRSGTAMFLPLAVVLVVIAILAFLSERTLDAVIFFGGAGLFWSIHEILQASPAAGAAAEPPHYAAWYFFVWAVYFFYVWLGSFSVGLERILFLLGLWLTLLALAIGDWGGGLHGFTLLGGYLGLITSIIAAITSALAIITRRVGPAGGHTVNQPA